MADLQEQATEARRRFNEELDQIRLDDRRSAAAKYDDIRELYESTQAAMRKLAAAYNEELTGERQRLITSLMKLNFRPAGAEESVAANAMYLDALDRAESVAEEEGAEGVQRLFRRARNIDSKPQQQACFAIAIERVGPLAGEWDAIVEDFVTLYPAFGRDIDALRLLNKQAGDPNHKFARSMTFSTPGEPVELARARPVG